MVWTFAICWIVYWSFRSSKGRDLGSSVRLWTVRVIALVSALVAVVAHWLVLGSVVDGLWPGLGYEGVAAILAEATVIVSGALLWGYLIPKWLFARFGASASSEIDDTADG